jgi:diguanylate cyclase (GGDEF)-like protein/PAS domain S-box-containing protein
MHRRCLQCDPNEADTKAVSVEGPGDASRQGIRSALRPRLLIALGLLMVGSLGGFLVGKLQEAAESAHLRASHANGVVASVLRVDALEWRAIAGEDVAEVSKRFKEQAEALRGSLESDSNIGSSELKPAAAAYLDAIEDEFAALTAGDRSFAELIDQGRVDPAYEHVIDLATAVAEREQQSADRTEREVRLVGWLLSLTVTGLLGAGAWIALRIRDRRASQRTADELDSRVRAMVHCSPDVFTTVTGNDALTVLSPSLGILSAIATTSSPSSIRDLLQAEQFNDWVEADSRVRHEHTDERIELAVNNRDGGVTFVEAHGTPLPGQEDERAWIWRDVTDREELERQLTHRAEHDPLTGVANRQLLLDRARDAVALASNSGRTVSMLYCDLDKFKDVNDTLGHDAGDQLLRIVATRIGRCLRSTDTLSRLGGDEFAVLINDADMSVAAEIGERIVEAIAVQATIGGVAIAASISIGLATTDGQLSASALLHAADVAMYSAKQSGRGRLATFHSGI